jgi:NAD(P)-dependent dehydrogenase (short-subunit alcohol dehydrogenase family)
MRGLREKVFVVAGGATGIGGATCRRLTEEGATVVVADINIDSARETVSRICSGGGTALAVEFDIAEEDSCAALMGRAVDEFGGLDGLFNVAADMSEATLGRDTDVVSVPTEVWNRSLAVNLTGYFHTCRHAVPRLLARGGGAIVNTVSGLVLAGDPTRVSYGASKAASLALSKHIAARWGREGVRCNIVAPGFVATEQALRRIPAEERERLAEMIRAPRFGTPDDIAATVAFLLSDDASWINGQLHTVNGGTGLR